MGEGRRKALGVGARWAAVAIIGTLVGSVLMAPAVAHLNSPLTFKHLKKHFYTKKIADSTFINVGEAATSATNADKLDNLDSAVLQQKCQPGAVLAYAFVDESALNTTALATTGLGPTFNCAGGPITAQKTSAGNSQLKIPGITDAATYTGKLVANVTAVDGGCFFGSCGTSSDTIAVLFPAKLGTTPASPDLVHVGTFDVAVDTDDGSGNDQSGGTAAVSDYVITVYAFG